MDRRRLAASPAADAPRLIELFHARRRVRAGSTLFSAGEAFRGLYAVRIGFFKTSAVDKEGREHVTAFPVRGELLGLDGFSAGCYGVTAVALKGSEVSVLPSAALHELARTTPRLQRELHAHAVHCNLQVLAQHEPDIVAVFAADHVYRMDLRPMVDFHGRRNAEVTVAAMPVPLEEASRFGVLLADADGRISAFHEKPAHPEPMRHDAQCAPRFDLRNPSWPLQPEEQGI